MKTESFTEVVRELGLASVFLERSDLYLDWLLSGCCNLPVIIGSSIQESEMSKAMTVLA